MKIDVTKQILDYEGNPLDGGTATYRSVISAALNNLEAGEQLLAEQKARMYELSVKIFKSKEVKLSVEEAAFVKERVAKFFNPLVYGRVSDLLEGIDRESGSDTTDQDVS